MSLKYQWRREITRFSGREASVNSGSRAVRMSHFAEPGFCKITNSLIEVDPTTGQRYWRLPIPEPEVVQQLSASLALLIARFGKP